MEAGADVKRLAMEVIKLVRSREMCRIPTPVTSRNCGSVAKSGV